MRERPRSLSPRILVVGCGDVGLRAARILAPRLTIYALTRSAARAAELRRVGIKPVLGDLDSPHTLGRLAGLADWVLHLAPPPDCGTADPRTARVLAALARRGSLPRRLIYISTSGVYGDCGGAEISEARAPRPGTCRARRRVDAERQLRRFGKHRGSRVSILRVPGIYAADRLPVERLKAGTPALVAEDDVYTNHLHAEDLSRAVVAALFRGRANRTYNAADGHHMKMADYFDLVADMLGLPRPPRISRVEAASRLSPTLLSFMSESRRLNNRRLTTELRVRLRYPHPAAALREMVRSAER